MNTRHYALPVLFFLTLQASSLCAMQFLADCFTSLEKSDSTVYKTGRYLFQQVSSHAQEYRNSQLFKAIERNEPEALYYALKKGAQVNARDKAGKTPLIKAIEAGKPGITAAILKNNPDINQQVAPHARRQAGMVPLMFALDKADKTDPKDPFSATAVTILSNPYINLTIHDTGGRSLEYWAKGKPALQQLVKHRKNQLQRMPKMQQKLVTIKPILISQ